MPRTIAAAGGRRAASARSLSAPARLKSIRIVGGFLDGVTLNLTRGLNCIIGARGTGKSTTVKVTAFGLDAMPPHDDPERRRIESLVDANLGDGQVELIIETREGLEYRVLRSANDGPVVLTTDGAPTQISLRSGAVFRAAIYNQNEIERIADKELSQLSLIDNFDAEQIAHISAEIRTLLSKLSTNASTLIPLQDQIRSMSDEIAGLPGIDEKIKTLGPITGPNAQVINKAQQAKSMRQREGQAVDNLWQYLQHYDQQIEELVGQIGTRTGQWIGRDLLAGANGTTLTEVKQILVDGGAEVDDLLRHARDRVARMQFNLAEAGTTLQGAHAQQEMAYQELVAQDTALRGQAAERAALDRLKNDLLAKQHQRDGLLERHAGLLQERSVLLDKLSELRDRRYEVRATIVKKINASLTQAIRVSLEPGGYVGEYRDLLEEALRGSRIKQGIVAQRIAERVAPLALATIARAGDVQTLQQKAGINEEQARKVIDALGGAETLFALETVELADRPRIELKDGEAYKETSALSTGQKCTTILPILLLDGDGPLIIDQPEDNLDNRFVCESVVESIRKVKHHRQLIFITHNPNIPVLADAERVFVLESDGAHAHVATSGTVDQCKDAIVNLLEGGEQAFKRRQKRYAYP